MERFIMSPYARAKMEREMAEFKRRERAERIGFAVSMVLGLAVVAVVTAPFFLLAVKG